MKPKLKVAYSPARLAARLAIMGRQISRDYAGRTVDAVVILENAFVFGADLVRRISRPVICHFLRSEMRDVRVDGNRLREVFFSREPELKRKDVLLIDAVLDTGVTQDFLIKRLAESRPRSLRVAVLFDRPAERRVDLRPDYFGFLAASNRLAGYGLAGKKGWYGNLPYVGLLHGAVRRAAGRGRPATRRAGRAWRR